MFENETLPNIGEEAPLEDGEHALILFEKEQTIRGAGIGDEVGVEHPLNALGASLYPIGSESGTRTFLAAFFSGDLAAALSSANVDAASSVMARTVETE